MVYLNGDNDLEIWMHVALNRLEVAACNPNIDIVALWDGRASDDTKLYHVKCDHDLEVAASYNEGIDVWSRGELDMGDPQTLVDFVSQARTAYPATRSFLSVIDHGNGWSPGRLASPRAFDHTGLSFDDSHTSYMSTLGFALALSRITNGGAHKLDVVFLDACLMAMIENVYPLRNYTRFVVASENQAFTGYPYDKYLEHLSSGLTAQDLVHTIVQEYSRALPGYPTTISAFNMSKAELVSNAVHSLAEILRVDQTNCEDLARAFHNAQRFNSNSDGDIGDDDTYVDLWDFALALQQISSSAGTRSAARNVQIALDSGFVEAEEHHGGRYWRARDYWNLQYAHGISIYLPLGPENDWLQRYYTKAELAFVADTKWDDVINHCRTPQSTTPPAPSERPGPLMPFGIFIPHLEKSAGN